MSTFARSQNAYEYLSPPHNDQNSGFLGLVSESLPCAADQCGGGGNTCARRSTFHTHAVQTTQHSPNISTNTHQKKGAEGEGEKDWWTM
jgi:hypothetical protein